MNKKELLIVYERFFDFEKNKIVSGGVQTYLLNLIPLFKEEGYHIRLFQFDVNEHYVSLDDCEVYAVSGTIVRGKYKTNRMIKVLKKRFDLKDSVLLFGDSCLNAKNDARYTISIQHGIWWDVPRKKRFPDCIMAIYSSFRTYSEHHRLKWINRLVCVDYNFPNWYKAQVDNANCDLVVVPNFTKIAERVPRTDEKRVSVIFARRLVPHRGTRVFTEAIKRVLLAHSNVRITIAGRGPDLPWMQDAFKEYSENVEFIEYSSKESIEIHKQYDIAAIPTVGSEGTSFSLLEAMSAQCAVVCTDVGGMTNIVIDGYNGLIVKAGDSESLYNALLFLIEHPEERKKIAACGYETVKTAFNYEKWKMQWQGIIQAI